MKKLKSYDVETANARFDLTIYEKSNGSGFVGEYSGTTPKFAQAIQPGGKTPMMKDVGQGTVVGSSVDEVENGKIRPHFEGQSYEVETKADIEKEILENLEKKKKEGTGKTIVRAPLPGTVISINVKIGSRVQEGAPLLKIIAMKMENEILAEQSGVVKEVRVKKNENVEKDDILMILE